MVRQNMSNTDMVNMKSDVSDADRYLDTLEMSGVGF